MSILQGCDLHSFKSDYTILVHHSHANSAPDRSHATACCLWCDCPMEGEMYLKCKFSLDPKVIARDLTGSAEWCQMPRSSSDTHFKFFAFSYKSLSVEREVDWMAGGSVRKRTFCTDAQRCALFRSQRTSQIIWGIVDTPSALHGVEDQRQNPPNFFPITN